MAKLAEDAAIAELPLNDERKPEPKKNRHVVIALNHMRKHEESLTAKIAALEAERTSLRESIKALE